MDGEFPLAISPEESEEGIHDDSANITEVIHVKELGRDKEPDHGEDKHDDKLEVIATFSLIELLHFGIGVGSF